MPFFREFVAGLSAQHIFISVLNREDGGNGGYLKMPCISCFQKLPGTFKMKSTSIGSPVQLWASLGTVSGLAKVDAIVNLIEHFLDQRIRHLASCGWNLKKRERLSHHFVEGHLEGWLLGKGGLLDTHPLTVVHLSICKGRNTFKKLKNNVNDN